MKTSTLPYLCTGITADKTAVFSGGMSNFVDPTGKLVRNKTRDELNQWLNSQGIYFYDPQIHPDTHGRNYNYDVDGPAEKAARAAAKVLIYQIGSETQSIGTSFEILTDVAAGRKVIVWFSGPLEKGKPIFAPFGLEQLPVIRNGFGHSKKVEQHPAVTAQLAEFKKGGTQVRKELIAFLENKPNVVFAYNLNAVLQALVSAGFRKEDAA